jgi:hypothetical protein
MSQIKDLPLYIIDKDYKKTIWEKIGEYVHYKINPEVEAIFTVEKVIRWQVHRSQNRTKARITIEYEVK